MIAADQDRGWSLRAAWRGAAKAAMPAYGAGALVGLITHTQVIAWAGVTALVAIVVAAACSIRR
jgi:hypothetical protein